MRYISGVIRSKSLVGWKSWGIYPDWGGFGTRVIFPVREVSSKVYFFGRMALWHQIPRILSNPPFTVRGCCNMLYVSHSRRPGTSEQVTDVVGGNGQPNEIRLLPHICSGNHALLVNSKTLWIVTLHPTVEGQRDWGCCVKQCSPMLLEIQWPRLNQQSQSWRGLGSV